MHRRSMACTARADVLSLDGRNCIPSELWLPTSLHPVPIYLEGWLRTAAHLGLLSYAPHTLASPRERKWKLTQCKKYSTTISKSNLGIEARAEHREKQEVDAVRKKMGWIAKQVCAFQGRTCRSVRVLRV